MDGTTRVPPPRNEPVLGYAPGSPERAELEARLAELAAEPLELTSTIGGEQRMAGGERFDVVQPHRHAAVLGTSAHATHADAAGRDPLRRRTPRRAGGTSRPTTAPRSSSRPPTCWPARGGRRSTPPRCSARARPRSRPRSTAPAS